LIPLAIPNLSGNEAAYLQEGVDTNFVSSIGPFVDRFERELAKLVELPNVVATSSGTAGLHVALVATAWSLEASSPSVFDFHRERQCDRAMRRDTVATRHRS
jgi:dTDP-4-amino-4,6-dideoxygalactose transaminase